MRFERREEGTDETRGEEQKRVEIRNVRKKRNEGKNVLESSKYLSRATTLYHRFYLLTINQEKKRVKNGAYKNRVLFRSV